MGCTTSKNRKITLLIVGIDNAGKSTLLGNLKGENVDFITPTVGFASDTIKTNGATLNAFDLGGGENFRGIWKHYYAEVHGVVFVIDASDTGRLEIAKRTLFESLEDPRFHGKPLLLFANKQDKNGAVTVEQLAASLELDKINGPKTLIACSALKKGTAVDHNIHNGMKWIVDQIRLDYKNINTRVRQQTVEQKERERKELEEKRKRVEAYRREREQQEAEEAKKELEEREKAPDSESVVVKEKPAQKQPLEEVISEQSVASLHQPTNSNGEQEHHPLGTPRG